MTRPLAFENPRLEDRTVPAQASLVRNIHTAAGVGSDPADFVDVSGIAFFTAETTANGRELWRSDGTSAGTTLVRDIHAGTADSYLTYLTNVNGTLFFLVDEGISGFDLWKSDGTSSGTTLVYDTFGAIRYLTAVGGTLFFQGENPLGDSELWKSNGTSSGTTIARDIKPGSLPSFPYWLTNVSGTLYFSANEGTSGYELWKSNGTSTGTVRVRDIQTGAYSSYPEQLANIAGVLFFSADNGAGSALWKSNGSSTGTVLVKNVQPIPGPNSLVAEMVDVNGALYFTANTAGAGFELWRSDGTSAGTVLVKDIEPGAAGSFPTDLTNVNGTLFFHNDTGFNFNSNSLWKSNGTSTGTVVVSNVKVGGGAPYLGFLTNVNGTLIFRADDFSTGTELWQSNGTSTGTTLCRDIRTGFFGSLPFELTPVGSTCFFYANDGVVGAELWRVDVDNVVPVVASITSTSANGTYSTGQSINVTVNFSEPVTLAGGNLNVTLDTGAVVSIAPFTGMSASVTYVVQVGQTSPDLNVTNMVLAGGATLRDTAGNNANLALPVSNLALNANIIVNPAAPTTNYTVNMSAIQRSRITQIDLSFSSAVNAATLATPGAITLTRTTPNDAVQVDVTNGLILSVTSGMVTSLALTFANVNTIPIDHTSLADGRWRLAIPSLSYQSALNDVNLRRLFGDIDANGTVNADDLAQFGNAFGSTGVSPFDFDNNGTINAGDFAEFGNRFGVTL